MELERLEDADESGEEIPLRTLLALTADAADRIGYPKRSIAISANLGFAAQLDRARKRSERVLKVVEPKVVPTSFVRRI